MGFVRWSTVAKYSHLGLLSSPFLNWLQRTQRVNNVRAGGVGSLVQLEKVETGRTFWGESLLRDCLVVISIRY